MFGQAVIGARPGLCYFAEGEVRVAGEPLGAAELRRRFLEPGDDLLTLDGAAEVLLGETSVLRVGGDAMARIVSNRPDDAAVELLTGAAIIDLSDIHRSERVTVRTPNASVALKRPGIYRFDIHPGRPALLRVFHGKARARVGERRFGVRGGRALMLEVDAERRLKAPFERQDVDGFDRWAVMRRERLAAEIPRRRVTLPIGGGDFNESVTGGPAHSLPQPVYGPAAR